MARTMHARSAARYSERITRNPCGGTAGTLIGLIFVVITLGMDHAQEGDALRIRIFVTPILVYFVSLLVIAMVMVPLARAVSLVGHRLRGHCLCAACRASIAH